VKDLEQRVIELEEENFNLKRNLAVTSSENLSLKNEVHLLKSRISPSVGQVIPPFVRMNPSSVRGVMLMVVLLSFGLLIGNVGFPGNPLSKQFVEMGKTRVFPSEGQFKPVSNQKVLSELLYSNDNSEQHFASRVLKNNILEENRNQSSAKTCTESTDSICPEISVKKEESDVLPLSPSSNEINWKPNTTYLVCSTMKQVVPPPHITEQFHPDNPQNLTFFILPSKTEVPVQDPSEQIVEITCLMSSMSVLSMETLKNII